MSTETIRLFKPRMTTTTFTQLLNSIRRHFNETAAASVLQARRVRTRNKTLSFSRSVFFSRPLSPSSLSLSFLADAAVIGYSVYRPSRFFSGQLLRPHAHRSPPPPPTPVLPNTFFFLSSSISRPRAHRMLPRYFSPCQQSEVRSSL